jgi:diguanylate cyclase (GGDEF)-like protein/PAS domain S-box-containing protein
MLTKMHLLVQSVLHRTAILMRSRKTLSWLLVGLVIVPIGLLTLAAQQTLISSAQDRDASASGGLQSESFLLYNLSQASSDSTADAIKNEMRHMAAVRLDLMQSYPDDVDATDAAWIRLRDAIDRTGHVDSETAYGMATASHLLNQQIRSFSRFHAEMALALFGFAFGMLLIAFAAAWNSLRVRENREDMLLRLRDVIDATNDYVAIATLDEKIVYMNAAYRRLRGIGEGDPVSHESHAEFFTSESYRMIKTVALPAALRKGHWQGCATIVANDGREVFVSVQMTSHRSPDGELEYVSTISRDISAQIHAENELHHSQERLQQAQSLARVGTWEQDARSGICNCSDELHRIFGTSPANESLSFSDLLELVHPDDRDRLTSLHQRAMRNGEPFDFEHRIVTDEGEFRFVHSRCECLRDKNGVITHLVGAVLDVTERRFAEQENLRLAAIVESSEDAIMAMTLDGIIVSWNNGAERLYGYSISEVTGRHASILIPSRDPRFISAVAQQILRGQTVENVETMRSVRVGTIMHISLTFSPIKDSSGAIIGMAGIGRDITERKLSEEALTRSESQLIEAQRIAKVGSWEYDPETHRLMWSQEVFRILDIDSFSTTPTIAAWESRYHVEDRAQHQRMMSEALEKGVGYSADLRLVMPMGEERWVHVKGDPILRGDGTTELLVGTIMEITERKEAEAKVREYAEMLERQSQELQETNAKLAAIATEDGLTGLKNHRAFQERFAEEFVRARRYKSELSILMIDVDNFKNYNDRHGHPAGDEVLKQIAWIMLAASRTTDVVARYGGEEFCIVLPQTDAIGARSIGERLRTAVQSADWAKQPVTISVGICSLEPSVRDHSEMVARADEALYQSKRDGRNCVTVYAPASCDATLNRAA